ncbi:hypothetical protein [Bartonella sp. CB169]|uniref:hypothetical protein n=1 Tax=Bartonella sp. CB169 TaxID=3112257 RepID=UPI00300DEB56
MAAIRKTIQEKCSAKIFNAGFLMLVEKKVPGFLRSLWDFLTFVMIKRMQNNAIMTLICGRYIFYKSRDFCSIKFFPANLLEKDNIGIEQSIYAKRTIDGIA